jgi:hypothetical protein
VLFIVIVEVDDATPCATVILNVVLSPFVKVIVDELTEAVIKPLRGREEVDANEALVANEAVPVKGPAKEPLKEPEADNPVAPVVATIFPVPLIAVTDRLAVPPPPITTEPDVRLSTFNVASSA